MKATAIAKRIRSFSPNFAIYEVEGIENLNFVDETGRQIPASSARNVVGVHEYNFTGWAKGKTGRHRLNEPNTETIVVGTIRKMSDGKLEANDWRLVNQHEIDVLYSQRVEFAL